MLAPSLMCRAGNVFSAVTPDESVSLNAPMEPPHVSVLTAGETRCGVGPSVNNRRLGCSRYVGSTVVYSGTLPKRPSTRRPELRGGLIREVGMHINAVPAQCVCPCHYHCE